MSVGVTKEPIDYSDADDDPEFGSRFRSMLGPVFPTSSRRVGRSMKKPPGPAVDDGQSDAGGGSDDSSENPASAMITRIGEVLLARNGKERLENLFLELAPHETEKADRTVAQIHHEDIFSIDLAKFGYNTSLDHNLENGQSASGSSGSSKSLDVDKVVEFLAQEIEMIAAENDLHCDRICLRALLHDVAEDNFP